MKAVGNIVATLLLIFAIIILLFAINMAIQSKNTNEDIFVLGFKPYIIQTGSMEPELKVNALIVIKKVTYEEIEVGDIISFKPNGSNINVCHRVIEQTDQGYITKGDNNNNPDLELVTKDNFSGKLVFKTNITSAIYDKLQSPKGIIQIIVLPLIVILLLYISYKLFSSSRPKAKRYKE